MKTFINKDVFICIQVDNLLINSLFLFEHRVQHSLLYGYIAYDAILIYQLMSYPKVT